MEQLAKQVIKKLGITNIGQAWITCLEKQKPKDTTPRKGYEKLIENFVETLRLAIAQRDGRIQMQLPHRSILQFTNNVSNETLLNMMYHPTAGVENLRMASEDYTLEKGPFRIPTFQSLGSSTATPEMCVDRMNALCKAVHRCYRELVVDKNDKEVLSRALDAEEAIRNGYITKQALVDWVRMVRNVLRENEKNLGLDLARFNPSRLELPFASGNELLAWTSFHCTTDCYRPTPDSTPRRDSLIKRSLFFDAIPRSMFSEDVWTIVWECHRRAIVDLGAGSGRGSKWGYHYEKDNEITTIIDPEWAPYLGGPSARPPSLVMIPERFRVKICSKWGNLHIDHAPLSNDLQMKLDLIAKNNRKKIHSVEETPSREKKRQRVG